MVTDTCTSSPVIAQTTSLTTEEVRGEQTGLSPKRGWKKKLLAIEGIKSSKGKKLSKLFDKTGKQVDVTAKTIETDEAPMPPKNLFLVNPCSFCNFAFADDDEGTKHYNEKHQCCVECGRQFKIYKSLCLHVQNIHRKEKNFQCNFCAERFGHTATKSRHMEEVHNHLPKAKRIKQLQQIDFESDSDSDSESF